MTKNIFCSARKLNSKMGKMAYLASKSFSQMIRRTAFIKKCHPVYDHSFLGIRASDFHKPVSNHAALASKSVPCIHIG